VELTHFQDAVASALLGQGPSAEVPWLAALEAQPGFAVYRNTALKGCIDALQANYPTVCQLVGPEWFRASALVYVRAHPPHDGLLVNYGAGFSAFLRDFEPAAGLPYLPPVAALDRSWTECHLAADAPALDRSWLARQDAATLALLRLKPHPAARWAWCEEHPAYGLWQCHRDGLEIPDSLACSGDGGLLTRPGAVVTWQPLARSGAVFLDACAGGLLLEAAASCAMAAEPATDFAALVGALLDAGALAEALPFHPTLESP